MSSNSNFSESPKHYMVLDAISRGMKKIDSIALKFDRGLEIKLVYKLLFSLKFFVCSRLLFR